MTLELNVNSYVTVEDANQILKNYLMDEDPLRDLYFDLSSKDKGRILYQSQIDLKKLKYRGFKADYSQTLAFPRITRAGFRSDMEVVKLAQVLNALSYIPNTTQTKTDESIDSLKRQGIKSYKLGDFSITLDGGSSTNSDKATKSGIPEKLLSNWLSGGFVIK